MLAVEKELRGQRIGSKLVQLCLDRMRLRGQSQTARHPIVFVSAVRSGWMGLDGSGRGMGMEMGRKISI